MFLDRHNEMHSLNERFSDSSAEFIIIYGRRRVGKSELIDQFIADKPGLRILAREETHDLQLKQVSHELIHFYNDSHLNSVIFKDWDSVFSYIRSHADRRVVLAYDEFPYLVREDPSLPSIIQYHWDTWMKDSQIFLILSGSSIRMMEEMTMQYRSPLYGRRTGQYLIKPLRFINILDYCQDFEKAVHLFAVFGGTPAYLLKADITKGIFENITQKILREDSVMFRDTEFVLQTEVSEPRYYFSILRTVSEGITTLSKISQNTGLETATVSKYLQTLMSLQLIRREIPAGESHRSKRGQYFLSDNYFSFWFRYVYPNTKFVEMGKGEELMHNLIQPTFAAYVGRKFEDCIQDLIWEFNSRELLPFVFQDCRRWWYKEVEIDLIATGNFDTMFCEVKWQDGVNAMSVYSHLIEKKETYFTSHKRKKEDMTLYYLIIGKSFLEKTYDLGDNVILWDIGVIHDMFRNRSSHAIHPRV